MLKKIAFQFLAYGFFGAETVQTGQIVFIQRVPDRFIIDELERSHIERIDIIGKNCGVVVCEIRLLAFNVIKKDGMENKVNQTIGAQEQSRQGTAKDQKYFSSHKTSSVLY